MLPLKKILCPLDFSGHSLKALDSAKELADKFNAELHLVNVIAPFPVLPASPHPVGFNVQSYEKELEENSKEQLEKVIKEKIDGQFAVKNTILKGDAAHEIIKYAN